MSAQIAFYKAFVTAKSQFTKIYKNKVNPHFKSKYADLDSVLEAVEPALHANGLFLTQRIDPQENGRMHLVCSLIHVEGYQLDSTYILPDLTDIQKMGGALTYARRYAVSALLSVTADDDTDGNHAKQSAAKQEAQSNKLPFTSKTEAIAWACKQLKIGTEEANGLFDKVAPDPQGKKSMPFYQEVMRLSK